nr:hypothetical protein [Methylomarinum sp. Ch1-1]MDP4520993.1 hypothetical protein [Methylomarinum sp. Ch1-1]
MFLKLRMVLGRQAAIRHYGDSRHDFSADIFIDFVGGVFVATKNDVFSVPFQPATATSLDRRFANTALAVGDRTSWHDQQNADD